MKKYRGGCGDGRLKEINERGEGGKEQMNKQAGRLGYRSEGVIHGWMGR